MKITDKIKSHEDACKHLNREPLNEQELLEKGFTPQEIIGRKLETITEALNEGKKLDIYSNDRRWFPVFWTGASPSGFSFGGSDYDNSNAIAGCGSRFCYVSEELSGYSGKQFIDLWREFIQ